MVLMMLQGMAPLELVDPTVTELDSIVREIQCIPQSLRLCDDEWPGDRLQLCFTALDPKFQRSFKLRKLDFPDTMSRTLGSTSRDLSSHTLLIFHPDRDILLGNSVPITVLLPVLGRLLLGQSVSAHIIENLEFISEHECILLLIIIILTSCDLSYFLSSLLGDHC